MPPRPKRCTSWKFPIVSPITRAQRISFPAELHRAVRIGLRWGSDHRGVFALGALVARDLVAQRVAVIEPDLLDLGVDGVIAHRLAEDLQTALEVAAEDRRLCVRDAHRPAGVLDVAAEQICRELV